MSADQASTIDALDVAAMNAGLPTYSELVQALRMHQEAAHFVSAQRDEHKATREWHIKPGESYMAQRVSTACLLRVMDASEHARALLARIHGSAA